MRTATVTAIKKELNEQPNERLVNLCLRLAKFKKENKELLTYLLYEAHDEQAYIAGVKVEIATQFEDINTQSYYWMKKSIRKILRNTKKYIRYTLSKTVEIELLIYFSEQMRLLKPNILKNTTLKNLYERQLVTINKSIATLHEDLQYDYRVLLEELD